MKLFVILTTGCIYFLFIRGWKKKPQDFYRNNKLFVWGHRGSPLKKTENTLPSFQKAIKQGVDGIELDVRCTKDRRAVVFHDQDLYRLAGKKEKIKEMNYDELKTIAFHDNTTIPLLDDIVGIVHQIKALNIEIKSDSLFSGYSAIKPVIKFIKENSLYKKCVVSCFNPLVLIKLKIKNPRVIIGYLYNKNVPLHVWHNIFWMRRVQPDSLHIHYSLIDSLPVRWAQKQNLKISSYTVNDKTVYQNIKTLKLDGIFSDNIEYLK